MARVFDGKALRDKILADLKLEVEEEGLKPRLEIILVGSDPASLAYIKQKIKAGKEIGAEVNLNQFPETISQENLLKEIEELNKNNKVSGIIVQLPLPSTLDPFTITQAVKPEKDVDGLNEDSAFQPATPRAVLKILESENIETKEKIAVVFGQSRLVGAPLVSLLEEEGAKVIPIDINISNPKELSLQGDVVISAVGKPGLITAEMVKDGVVIVDVGTTRNPLTGKLEGDVDFEKVSQKASLITPVPGGVGPMTVAMLMSNLVQAAKVNHS